MESAFRNGKFTEAGELTDMLKFKRDFDGMREEITVIRKLKKEGNTQDYFIKKKMKKEGKTGESETEINIGGSGNSGAVGKKVAGYLKRKVRRNMIRERILALNDLKYVNSEMKADLHLGKTMTDVHGNRVRIEEYVFRPAPDQVDLLSLSFRDNRLDYLRVNTTFNAEIPKNITQAQWKSMWQYKWAFDSAAYNQGKPDYYRKSEVLSLSNTLDRVDMLTKYGLPVNSAPIQPAGGMGEFNYWVLPKTEFMLTINADIRAIDKNYSTYYNATVNDILGPTSIKEHKAYTLYTDQATNATPMYQETAFPDDKTFTDVLAIPYSTNQNYTPTNAYSAPAKLVYPGTRDLAATQTRHYNDGSTLTTTMWLIDDYGRIMKSPTSILEAVNLLFNTNVELNIDSSEFKEGDIDVVSKLLWWIALNPNGKNTSAATVPVY